MNVNIFVYISMYKFPAKKKKKSIALVRVSKGFLTSKCLQMLKAVLTLCVVQI